jgi:hypothetical protein
MVERGESRPDGDGNSTRGNDEGKALVVSGADVSCTELLETDPASGSNWKIASRDNESFVVDADNISSRMK